MSLGTRILSNFKATIIPGITRKVPRTGTETDYKIPEPDRNRQS